MDRAIVVENISKSFDKGKKQAVNGISFTVGKGEIFALLGPNGAGKTTSLRMLATLLTPDSGSIWLDGVDAIAFPEKAREKIGFLTSKLKQEECFSPDYLFDFFASLYKMDTDLKAARKKELFEHFGIDKYAHKALSRLSDGMKQKVSLALSVLHDPQVIIFDEPTNGLDIVASRLVLDFLKEQKEKGKAIIISTHIFDLAEKLCDSCGILIDGRLSVCGEMTELCREKCLEDLFFEQYDNH